jgi:nucleoside-diphosphate-sugar epimerase
MKRSNLNRRAAVTGAGGFVGSRLVSGLLARGWDVYAVSSQPLKVANGAVPIACDWSKQGIANAVTQARDAVLWIHAAAYIDFTDQNIMKSYESNALFTDYLATNVACQSAESVMVYLSTVSVYGRQQEISLAVDPLPDSHYGLSKLLGERLCVASLDQRCVIVRLAGVWGFEPNPKLFVNRCLGDARGRKDLQISGGQSKRNYLWVGDVAAICTRAFDERWSGIRIAGGPELLSTFEMAKAIADRFGVGVEVAQTNDTSAANVVAFASPDVPTTSFGKALAIETENA